MQKQEYGFLQKLFEFHLMGWRYKFEMSSRRGASKQRPVPAAWAFVCSRTRSEDSADRVGRKSPTDVLRQESEGEVTQGEIHFDRSDRVLPGVAEK